MPAVRIDVHAENRDYAVVIGGGLLRRLKDLFAEHNISGQSVVVTCRTVWQRHGHLLRAVTGRTPPVLIGEGERAKTLATVGRIYDALVQRKLDRSATIVAFGGGVVGDVAGFAAATYLRGVRLVQVPTTLLAQVDSSVGGKVGVNLSSGKNLVGAFCAPALVICDPTVLASLPARELRAGLYEVVKYGVIRSRELFDRLSARLDSLMQHDAAELDPVIAECCRIKASVVEQDEREAGPRRILNFGHTIGHALEAVTRYRRFKHGEAIAYGMIGAARISASRGLMPEADEAALDALLRRMGPRPPVVDLKVDDALGAMTRDKKVVGGRLHFVLSAGIGHTVIVDDVSRRELRDALRTVGLRR
jgi:3-dehydroquinate synthase